jgi:hypothetical protein
LDQLWIVNVGQGGKSQRAWVNPGSTVAVQLVEQQASRESETALPPTADQVARRALAFAAVIDQCSSDTFSTARSIARERHQAINWVWEGPEVYNAASAST